VHRDFLDLMAARWGLRRHVLLGGGNETFFENVFAELLENFRREQQAIAAGAFHAAGGAIAYLVSGMPLSGTPARTAQSRSRGRFGPVATLVKLLGVGHGKVEWRPA